jgi:hypothetical protein
MDIVKHAVLPLWLLVATLVFANPDCRTIADDVANQDQVLKTRSQEFTDLYGENNNPGMEVRQDYLGRLDALINALHRDIDGLRWLIDHHCGPAGEEPNAIKSVHDLESILVALLVRRMDARGLR